MNLLLSLISLGVLVGVIVWVKKRGYFQHAGCTCRRAPNGTHVPSDSK